jgi:hypothetical protein
MSDELITQRRLQRLQFFQDNCKRCIGTQIQINRKCGKLRGFNSVFCKKLDNYLNKQNIELKEEMLNDMLQYLKPTPSAGEVNENDTKEK